MHLLQRNVEKVVDNSVPYAFLILTSSFLTKKRTPWWDAFLGNHMRQLLPSILPRHLGQVMTILPLPRGTRHTVRQLGQVKYL